MIICLPGMAPPDAKLKTRGRGAGGVDNCAVLHRMSWPGEQAAVKCGCVKAVLPDFLRCLGCLLFLCVPFPSSRCGHVCRARMREIHETQARSRAAGGSDACGVSIAACRAALRIARFAAELLVIMLATLRLATLITRKWPLTQREPYLQHVAEHKRLLPLHVRHESELAARQRAIRLIHRQGHAFPCSQRECIGATDESGAFLVSRWWRSWLCARPECSSIRAGMRLAKRSMSQPSGAMRLLSIAMESSLSRPCRVLESRTPALFGLVVVVQVPYDSVPAGQQTSLPQCSRG